MADSGSLSRQSYPVGAVVLMDYAATLPAEAEVMAYDDRRPNVVKVKYLHSRTAAWVARGRILGLAGDSATLHAAAAAGEVVGRAK